MKKNAKPFALEEKFLAHEILNKLEDVQSRCCFYHLHILFILLFPFLIIVIIIILLFYFDYFQIIVFPIIL